MGLPRRPFLYSLEQIAGLLSLSSDTLKAYYLYYVGRSVGIPRKDRLKAIQVAPCECGREEWRVEEAELLRWMKVMGLRAY